MRFTVWVGDDFKDRRTIDANSKTEAVRDFAKKMGVANAKTVWAVSGLQAFAIVPERAYVVTPLAGPTSDDV